MKKKRTNSECIIIAKKLLKRHEGLGLRVYRCTSHKHTIGYGRNLDDNMLNKAECLHYFKYLEASDFFEDKIKSLATSTEKTIQIEAKKLLFKYGVSVEIADYLLDNDIIVFVKVLEKYFPVAWDKLSDIRRAVLIDMVFALGEDGMFFIPNTKDKTGFKNLVACIKKEDYTNASKEILDSKWGRSKAKRRVRELSKIMLTNKLK